MASSCGDYDDDCGDDGRLERFRMLFGPPPYGMGLVKLLKSWTDYLQECNQSGNPVVIILGSDSVDLVICDDSKFIGNLEEFIGMVLPTLKPGGKLAFVAPWEFDRMYPLRSFPPDPEFKITENGLGAVFSISCIKRQMDSTFDEIVPAICAKATEIAQAHYGPLGVTFSTEIIDVGHEDDHKPSVHFVFTN